MNFRHTQIAITFVTTILLAVQVVFGSDPEPTSRPATEAQTSPTTKPAGYALRGQLKTQAYLDIEKPDLSRAVVYLESSPDLDSFNHGNGTHTVAQRDNAFVPNFIVIPKGDTVEFPNWDKFSHNVFSRSAAAPAFDLLSYPYGQSKSRMFDKTGVVQVFCNIHPFMKAIIFVTPNTFFTRANADGHFELTGIPAGKYQLTAWQERCESQHQAVEVGPNLTSELSLTIGESRQSILTNDPPKHGDSYGIECGLVIKREKLDLPVVKESHPAPTTQPCDFCP